MKADTLKAAIDMAGKVNYVLIATADSQGIPHVAAAKDVSCGSNELVTVKGWFCPGTVANLQENVNVSLVLWDQAGDRGYQLLGKSQKMEEIAILNGYEAGMENKIPQVERELVMKIDKILEFKHAPHSDIE